jgi:hypothetical protein
MDPKILKMKVWEINKSPVFYGYDEEDSVYSVIDKAITGKPSHLSLMASRELEPRDLPDVVLHNQISDNDFSCLLECGLVPPGLEALFGKIQELQKQLSYLRSQDKPAPAPEPAEESPALQKNVVDAIIQIVKGGILGQSESVLDQILNNSHDLTVQEKHILKLVEKHFHLGSSQTPI